MDCPNLKNKFTHSSTQAGLWSTCQACSRPQVWPFLRKPPPPPHTASVTLLACYNSGPKALLGWGAGGGKGDPVLEKETKDHILIYNPPSPRHFGLTELFLLPPLFDV